jgi:hypothetical protein
MSKLDTRQIARTHHLNPLYGTLNKEGKETGNISVGPSLVAIVHGIGKVPPHSVYLAQPVMGHGIKHVPSCLLGDRPDYSFELLNFFYFDPVRV